MPIQFPNLPKIFQVEPQVQHTAKLQLAKTRSDSDLFRQVKQLGIESQSKSMRLPIPAGSKKYTSFPSPETIVRQAEVIRARYGFDIEITYDYNLYRSNRAYKNLIDKLERPSIHTTTGSERTGTDKLVMVEKNVFSQKPIIYIPLPILFQSNVLSAMRLNNPKIMTYLDELRDNNLNDEEILIMFKYVKNILDSNHKVLIYLPSGSYKGGLLYSSGDDVAFLRERYQKFIKTLITSPIKQDMIDFTIEIGDKALLRDNNLEPVSRENGIVIVSPAYFKESR